MEPNLIERSETKELKLEDLRLDSRNVRLLHVRDQLGVRKLSDKAIEEYFWDSKEKQQTKLLYQQVLAARGLFQEPVVDREGVVREGNRRIVVLRKLKSEANAGQLEGISKSHFDKVKCVVLPPDASENEISLMIATIHIKGKKAWDAYDKAKYVARLHDEFRFGYEFLARTLNMGKVTLIRMNNAYAATKRYGERFADDDKDWYQKYTYFDELFKRRALREWRDDQSNVELFSSWVHDGKFDDVRDVRKLDEVLKYPEAMKTLDERKFSDALRVVMTKNPSIADANFRKITDTIEVIKSLSRKELVIIMSDNYRIDALQKLRSEIDALLRDIAAIRDASKKEGEFI